MKEMEDELLEVRERIIETSTQVTHLEEDIKSSKEKAGNDLGGDGILLAEAQKQLKDLQVLLETLKREEASLTRRINIYSRICQRGNDPSCVPELNEDSLDKLEKRLDKIESAERNGTPKIQKHAFILSLMSRKTYHVPLQVDDLVKDSQRVMKHERASLVQECAELEKVVFGLENQLRIMMSREDTDDQIVNLRASVARIENELKEKQDRLVRLNKELERQS